MLERTDLKNEDVVNVPKLLQEFFTLPFSPPLHYQVKENIVITFLLQCKLRKAFSSQLCPAFLLKRLIANWSFS